MHISEDTLTLREGEHIGFVGLHTQPASLESAAGSVSTQHIRNEAQSGFITLEC